MKTARILEGKPYTGNWNVTIGKRFVLLAAFAFVLGAQGDYVWNGGSAGSEWTGGSLWMVGGAASAWADGNTAVFETAGDAATLNADVSAAKVDFRANATVGGTATLTVPDVSVASGVSATISAPTAGALTKNGAGALTLGATRTAQTTVEEGALVMANGATVDSTKLTLGADAAKPVTLDYGGQELSVNSSTASAYMKPGTDVTLSNGTFKFTQQLNLSDDANTPATITVAKGATLDTTGRFIIAPANERTVNVAGGTMKSESPGWANWIMQASLNGRLNINVTEGGLLLFGDSVHMLTCRDSVNGSTDYQSPSLYVKVVDSTLRVNGGGLLNFGKDPDNNNKNPVKPTGVFAATNSVIDVLNAINVGDAASTGGNTEGSYTADFENCTITSKTITVYQKNRPLNAVQFGGGTRYVFRDAGNIVAPSDDAKWFTVGEGGFVIDKNGKSVTVNANFGGTGAVTSAGNGTLTIARSQTASAPLVCEAGTTVVNAGLSVARAVTVKGGATLSVNGASQVSLSGGLALEAGATLNVVGTEPVALASLTLPASGTAKLTRDGDGGFSPGTYTILEMAGIAVADVQNRLNPETGFEYTWSVEGNRLVLTVAAADTDSLYVWNGGSAGAGWTGGTPWLFGNTASAWQNGKTAVFRTAGDSATVNGDVSAALVDFRANTTVGGSSTLTAAMVNVNEDVAATINAPTTGELTKTGAGTLTLGVSRSAQTTVEEGALVMANGATVDSTKLMLGTDAAKPVTLDYGGQTLSGTPGDYTVNGMNVTLTNGVFSNDGDIDYINLMPAVLTIAKGAAFDCSGRYSVNPSGHSIVNIAGGAFTSGAKANNWFMQASANGWLDINVTDGGLFETGGNLNFLTCQDLSSYDTPTVNLTVTGGSTIRTKDSVGYLYLGYYGSTKKDATPSLSLTAEDSFIVAADIQLGNDKVQPASSYTADFENCVITSGTFQVRGNTQTVNARFGGGTRYVFRGDASIVAPSDDAKWFTAGEGGFVIDKNGKNVTLNANFGGTGAVTSAGNGTLTVVRSQTASAPLVCEAGTLAVNAGLSVARPVTVKGGATFTVPGTDQVTLADVAFEEGAEFHINELTGVAPIAVAGLTLPEGGAVSLTKNGGFATGVYRILEKTGIAVSDVQGKLVPVLTDNALEYSWAVDGNTLVLFVGNPSGIFWTGFAGDGKMSSAGNWLNNVAPKAGDDIDFSSLSGNATINADIGATFDAVTMGEGVVTFTGALAAKSLSDTSKVAVGANATVTLDGDLVLDTLTARRYVAYSVAAGGLFRVTGTISGNGNADTDDHDIWPTVAKCDGAVAAKGLVSDKGTVSGKEYWSFRLARDADSGTCAKWLIGSDGFSGEGGFWISLWNKASIQAEADFSIDSPIGLRNNWANPTLTLNTTDYTDSSIGRTITGNAVFTVLGTLTVEGKGTFLCNYSPVELNGKSAYSGEITVQQPATFAINPGKYPTTGSTKVNSGAALKVAQSGTVALGGNLSLGDGAVLGFNYTNMGNPVLALEGKTVTFAEGATTNVTVRITAADGVRAHSGRNVLTTGGKFADATVTLEAGAPKWVKGVSVENGEIVLEAKPAGTVIICR